MVKGTSVRIRDNYLNRVRGLKAELFLESGGKRNPSIQDLLCVIISNTDFEALKKELLKATVILISED